MPGSAGGSDCGLQPARLSVPRAMSAASAEVLLLQVLLLQLPSLLRPPPAQVPPDCPPLQSLLGKSDVRACGGQSSRQPLNTLKGFQRDLRNVETALPLGSAQNNAVLRDNLRFLGIEHALVAQLTNPTDRHERSSNPPTP